MPGPEADWLRLQKQIFGRWVNQKLSVGRFPPLEGGDILTGLAEVTPLKNLMEFLSESTYNGKKLSANPKMRVQKIENANNVLEWTWSLGVACKIKPSGTNIVDMDERAVLGLVWAIMLRFLKLDEEEGSDSMNIKDALLMWVNNKIGGYNHIGEIKAFGKEWHNGLAFNAIIHKHRPKLVDYDSLVPSAGPENLAKAQDAALIYFQLDKFLSPSDIPKLDQNSMLVYVSEFFYGIAEQRKLDLAARRIGKVVKLTEENDALRAEYNAKAADFKSVMDRTVALLNDRTIDDTMAGAKKRLADFYEWKAGDKMEVVAGQLSLQGVYNVLSMRLSHNKRPAFQPPAGLTLEDVDAQVKRMEEAEQERKIALHKELARQERLLKLDGRHKAQSGKLATWALAKEEFMAERPNVLSVTAAQLELRKLEAADDEVSNVKSSSFEKQLKPIGAELTAERYERVNEVADRETSLADSFLRIVAGSDAKLPVMEDHLSREQFKERVRLQDKNHGDRYSKLQAWYADKNAYLQTQEQIDSVAEAQTQLSLLDAYDAEKVMQSESLVAPFKKLGADILAQEYKTQYSQWVWPDVEELEARHADVDSKWVELDGLAASKRQVLDASLAREIEKERLRMEFAHQAGELQRWAKDQCENASVSEFGFNLAEVEAYSATLDESDDEINAQVNARIRVYREVNASMQDLGVTDVKYTDLTLGDLEEAKNALDAALVARRAAYDTELARVRADDALCVRFSEVASPHAAWVAGAKDEVTRSDDEIEDQLEAVNARIASLAADGTALPEAESLQQQMEARGISYNPHTTLTHKDLTVQWTQWAEFLNRKKTQLEEEIESKNRRGLTPEQLQEIEDNFAQFGKTGSLDKRQLKACMYSLGEERPTSEIAAICTEHGDGSSISYDGFKELMIAMLGDSDTKEEILDGFNLINRGAEVGHLDKMEIVLADHDLEYVKTTAPDLGDSTVDYKAWTDDVFAR
eukprot:TRINITY_DN3969_c0_g1_i1.p1 TRINITY_DN3969_c0_g1~~TRINITY_DN3969_c0_g1_i1.p1  ORF type:complete len:1004 (+),score=356.20 TRINITY_DN3969_c0_g1_i1:73-3012(+)